MPVGVRLCKLFTSTQQLWGSCSYRSKRGIGWRGQRSQWAFGLLGWLPLTNCFCSVPDIWFYIYKSSPFYEPPASALTATWLFHSDLWIDVQVSKEQWTVLISEWISCMTDRCLTVVIWYIGSMYSAESRGFVLFLDVYTHTWTRIHYFSGNQ